MRRLAVLFLLLALSALPARALARPPIWIVRDANSTIVLFGSVHLLPSGLDWRPPELTEALSKADDVWFEMPINEATDLEIQRLAETHGFLPKGDILWNHLTPDQAERLRRMGASLNLYLPALERWRPWYAELELSIIADAQAGGSASEGVERQILGLIPPTARRRAFETPWEQVSFLSAGTTAEQVASLDETLNELEKEPDLYQHVVQDWMNGDVASIASRVLDPVRFASPGAFNRMVTVRNERWSKVIARRMAGSGRTVIVVGVGHLVGPGGVPALLRARGFTVEGP
jgi:uncharacterized protein YbaP (TraB family)